MDEGQNIRLASREACLKGRHFNLSSLIRALTRATKKRQASEVTAMSSFPIAAPDIAWEALRSICSACSISGTSTRSKTKITSEAEQWLARAVQVSTQGKLRSSRRLAIIRRMRKSVARLGAVGLIRQPPYRDANHSRARLARNPREVADQHYWLIPWIPRSTLPRREESR
jgi:hypothetical protein